MSNAADSGPWRIDDDAATAVVALVRGAPALAWWGPRLADA